MKLISFSAPNKIGSVIFSAFIVLNIIAEVVVRVNMIPIEQQNLIIHEEFNKIDFNYCFGEDIKNKIDIKSYHAKTYCKGYASGNFKYSLEETIKRCEKEFKKNGWEEYQIGQNYITMEKKFDNRPFRLRLLLLKEKEFRVDITYYLGYN